jgi:hypothetical protein
MNAVSTDLPCGQWQFALAREREEMRQRTGEAI